MERIDYRNKYFDNKSRSSKPVKLFINDFNSDKVYSVNELIEAYSFKNCKVLPHNLDASEMFEVVEEKINAFPSRERSLVFVDPYGYSKISKDKLYAYKK